MKTNEANGGTKSHAQQNHQGNSKADREFNSLKNDKKKIGISNAGGQRSDQTSNEKAIQREKREE